MPEAACAAAMELGEVLGLHGLHTVPSSKQSDLSSLPKKPRLTQSSSCSYSSPFLDEQKMLRFSMLSAHTLPSGLDSGRTNEQRLFLARAKMPFTPSQWMELEHQALIYKYIHAQAPIPSSLLISISKSFRSSTNRTSWRPLYQGFTTNADSDPEPGRCRRTDGKKWRCSKYAVADHKYCERHINRNRHRSRKPVENQPKKTAKGMRIAVSSSSALSSDSFKKAQGNNLQPGIVSYWTQSLNRTSLGRDKANAPAEDNIAMPTSANQKPTISLLSQLKQRSSLEALNSALGCESISSTTMPKPWGSFSQGNNKQISGMQLNNHEHLRSVIQDFIDDKSNSVAVRLPKNEKIKSERNKYSHTLAASDFLKSCEVATQDLQKLAPLKLPKKIDSSPKDLHNSCPSSDADQLPENCMSTSWEMSQCGPLGEILTNSKNTETNLIKQREPDSGSYSWLLNLESQTT